MLKFSCLAYFESCVRSRNVLNKVSQRLCKKKKEGCEERNTIFSTKSQEVSIVIGMTHRLGDD